MAQPMNPGLSEAVAGSDENHQIQTAMVPVPAEGSSLPGLEALCAAAIDCQREMADFVAERLEKDQEAVRAALASKDWAEVTTIQARWFQQTVQDYAAEMSKILAIYTKYGAVPRQITH